MENNQRAVRRAKIFWEQSQQDIKAARAKLKGGADMECGFLCLQAAVNALSAVCFLNGHFQLPSASAHALQALCRDADSRFEGLEEACQQVESVTENNPFSGVDHSAIPARDLLAQSGRILDTVKAYLKDNRKRFFAP